MNKEQEMPESDDILVLQGKMVELMRSSKTQSQWDVNEAKVMKALTKYLGNDFAHRLWLEGIILSGLSEEIALGFDEYIEYLEGEKKKEIDGLSMFIDESITKSETRGS